MLQPGNSKLGPLVRQFSLPAVQTCPGRTKACEKFCYAQDGFFNMPCVRASLLAAEAETRKKGFSQKMIQEILRKKVRTVRIHVSGDFYSAEYVRKWIAIAKRCTDTRFYAYTRSWRKATILPVLLEFAALTNVSLWWSTDAETAVLNGKPPVADSVRVAHAAEDYEDHVPVYANLLFRVQRDTLEKFRNGCLVCPAENGMVYPTSFGHMTCTDCKICSSPRDVPAKQRGVNIPECRTDAMTPPKKSTTKATKLVQLTSATS